jgi:hypothetical protein
LKIWSGFQITADYHLGIIGFCEPCDPRFPYSPVATSTVRASLIPSLSIQLPERFVESRCRFSG